MKRGLALMPFVFALAVVPLAPVPAPAQPAEAPAPAVLDAAELAMWQAWLRADLPASYAAAQSLLENPGLEGERFRVALALQGRAADELAWSEAQLRDLSALVLAREGEPEGDLARWELMGRLRKLGRLDDIAGHTRALGLVTNCWVCGPFANDRGQGFEDVLPPEEGFSPEGVYEGKDGRQVRFRRLPATPLDGTINLGAMLRPNEEVAAFVMTAFFADTPCTLTLRVAASGPVKIWRLGRVAVDGEGAELEAASPLGVPVLEEDVEHPAGFDQACCALNLRQGWNVLVLKAGIAEGDGLLRLRLPGVRQAADDAELAAAFAAVRAAPESPVVEDVPAKPGEFHAAAAELLSPRRDSTSTMPRLWMDNLLNRLGKGPAPADAAVLHYIAAWANRASTVVLAGKEENRRHELLERCLQLDPAAARAALEIAQYYTNTFSSPSSAAEYARRAVTLRPGWLEARLFASRVVQMKGLTTEVERELLKLQKDFPDHPGVLKYAGYYAGLRENYALSNQLFEAALRADHTDEYARGRLLERACQRGDSAAALRFAAQQRRLDPFDTGAASLLAAMFLAGGQHSLAERELEAALRIAPEDDELLALLGRVYASWAAAEKGERAAELRGKSLQAVRDALASNPNRQDLERYLEFADSVRPKFEELLQEDIDARIREALAAPAGGDDPYEVVYRDTITVVNEDGTTAQYQQLALRVNNDLGREALQSHGVPAGGDQQGRCVGARLWRADGAVEEGRRSQFEASFPPLEVGDIVHLRFRVADREQSFFGEFYGALEPVGDYVPVREQRLVWVLPPGREFYEYRTGAAPARAESTVEGRRVWTYTARNLAKLPDEPLAPPIHQLAPTVQISTYRDWKEFGRWYYNLIRKQMEPTPEMKAKVEELTRGLKTEQERARAVYTWVVTQVRYNADWHFGVHGYKPFSAGAVFARCIGDCKDKALLICTMLGIAGVRAYPVIISLEPFRGQEDITLPMPHHFNHAIAYIEYADGTGQFVDGTATYNGMDELPGGDAGAAVVIVRPEGGVVTRVPTPAAAADCETDEIEAEFVAGGALRLTVKRTAVGDSASSLRAQFEREGDRKRQLEMEWAEFFPGARVSGISTGDLADLSAVPEIRYTVELPGAVTEREGSRVLRLAPNPREWGKTAFAALTTRKTALLLTAPFSRRAVWRFRLPQGFQAGALPAALKAEHARVSCAFSAALEEEGRVLRVERSYEILGGAVTPAEYAEFRKVLQQFDQAEAQTLALKK
ncbi:MAG: DUF3857 domain-containing protein [Planctomycetes bacterium]|nr:DUF3857 domain-containing protein [Planctomycetota bacterium]